MKPARSTLFTLLLLAGLAPFYPRATAQNALDANLRVGSGGRNEPRGSFYSEVALRNAMVTGNVGGGRQFRGDVGYSAPFEFRGSVGSESVFQFTRNAPYTGAGLSNVRGLTSIQYQLSHTTTGEVTSSLGTRDLLIRRQGVSTSIEARPEFANSPLNVPVVDSFGRLDGSLRSTSDFYVRAADTPSVLGVQQDTRVGAPRVVRAATPLHGVRALAETDSAFGPTEVFDPNRSLEEQRRAQQGTVAQPGFDPAQPQTPLTTPGDPGAQQVEPSRSPLSQSLKIETAVPVYNQYLQSMEREAERLGIKVDARVSPTTTPAETPEPLEGEGTAPAPLGVSPLFDSLREQLLQPPTEPTSEPQAQQPYSAADQARALLEAAAPQVERLIPDDIPRDLYSLHMNRGQESLAEARWFDAEERFSAALQERPNDPMASAGRIHAQIGAGLIRSASLNLRLNLLAYPELINAKYDSRLLPGTERHDRLRAQLKDRIERATLVEYDAALLLAYLGYQFGIEGDIRDAFKVLESDSSTELRPLYELLKTVWLKQQDK